jgi:hypothetical protein
LDRALARGEQATRYDTYLAAVDPLPRGLVEMSMTDRRRRATTASATDATAKARICSSQHRIQKQISKSATKKRKGQEATRGRRKQSYPIEERPDRTRAVWVGLLRVTKEAEINQHLYHTAEAHRRAAATQRRHTSHERATTSRHARVYLIRLDSSEVNGQIQAVPVTFSRKNTPGTNRLTAQATKIKWQTRVSQRTSAKQSQTTKTTTTNPNNPKQTKTNQTKPNQTKETKQAQNEAIAQAQSRTYPPPMR